MSFEEIQKRMAAAFAATGAAPAPTPAAPPAAPTFTPSPFQPAAFTPPAAAPAPTAPAFTFTPPVNAATPPNGGPWSPINPPGERVALGAPAPTGALHNLKVAEIPPGAVTAAQAFTPIAPTADAVAQLKVEEPAAEPPKRKRRTKAEMAAEKGIAEVEDALNRKPLATFAVEPQTIGELCEQTAQAIVAAHAQELKDLPADGSTVEDIVEELFARGVTQVNLTFAKYGRT